MKATMTDGVVFEGTPDEIREFFEESTPKKAKKAKKAEQTEHGNHRKRKKRCKSRPNANIRWGKFESVKLIKLLKEGKSIKEIAKWLGRTTSAVRGRIHVLKKAGLTV